MKVMANIHSLQDKKTGRHNLGEAEILEIKDNNNVIARYNGVKCTAIFNIFTGTYFVDDIYGRIVDDVEEAAG